MDEAVARSQHAHPVPNGTACLLRTMYCSHHGQPVLSFMTSLLSVLLHMAALSAAITVVAAVPVLGRMRTTIDAVRTALVASDRLATDHTCGSR